MPDYALSASRSEFLDVRGLRYHVRRWGEASRPGEAGPQAVKPMLFLLHGWLDVSATFETMVQPLLDRWQVLAPDWRGFGLSQWVPEGYWFMDYLADLEVILDHYSPDRPVDIIGHSMGAQALSQYAGARPDRIRRMALLDALFLPEPPVEAVTQRLRQWLDEVRRTPRVQEYPGYEQLAERIRRLHPRLSAERALFVAHCWGYEIEPGRIGLRADPQHRRVFPTLYRSAEAKTLWRQITAPTLFIDGGLSELRSQISDEEHAERRACFALRQEVTLADAGHMLHFEAAEETAHLLRAFFAA